MLNFKIVSGIVYFYINVNKNFLIFFIGWRFLIVIIFVFLWVGVNLYEYDKVYGLD